MKRADTLVNTSQASETVAERVTEKDSSYQSRRHDLVDAINQMFAEFELAYHNQFHKAYPDEGSSGLAKKYWLSQLQGFSPEVLLKATRKIVSSEPYLPSLSTLIRTCENAHVLFGLPTAREAYVEACCAPEPKAAYAWSHPAVYLAAVSTGWFELANQPESRVFSRFEYHYEKLCERVAKGEDLDLPVQEALPEKAAESLEPKEQKRRLRALRGKLGL